MTYSFSEKKMKCLYKNYYGLPGQDLSMVESTVKKNLQYDIEIQKKADGTVDLLTNTVHIFKWLSETPPGVHMALRYGEVSGVLTVNSGDMSGWHVVLTNREGRELSRRPLNPAVKWN